MALDSLSLRFTNSRTDDPFSDSSFLQQYGMTIPVMTSVSQFVSILQRYNVRGPENFNNVHLDNPLFFKHIGHGAQFTVFKPVWGASNQVVMKRAFLSDSNIATKSPFEIREDFRRRLKTLEVEVKALCHNQIRQHPNIVALKSWGYDYPTRDPQHPSPVLIVEEATCTLATLLRSPDTLRQEGLSTMSKYQLCLDITSGLECLHQCNIVHGDLKPDNILIFKGNHEKVPYLAKLADFGLCITIESKEDLTYSRYRSTWGWQPPETTESSLKGCQVEPELLYKCDSYSYGLLVLSTLVLNGESPLGGSNRSDTSTIRNEVISSISRLKTTSLHDRMLLEKHSRRVLTKFLAEEPQRRSFASMKLLEDTSCQGYIDWTAAAAGTQRKNPMSIDAQPGRNSYAFWSRIQRPILRQLIEDHRSSFHTNSSLQLPGHALFGMAIGYIHNSILQPDFRDVTLDCCSAAVRADPPSNTAQAILPRLSAAMRPEWELEAEFDVENMLFQAGCSGSWFAVKQLAERNYQQSTACRQLYRLSGGYNEERLDLSALVVNTQASPEIASGSNLLNIPIVALRDIKVTGLANIIPSQLYKQPIDETGNTILHLVSMLGREDLISYIVEKDTHTINQVNNAGETPLYKACAAGNAPAIRRLLQLGADPSIKQKEFGISCLHWLFQLEENEAEDIAALLIQRGACVSCRTNWDSGRNRSRSIRTEHFPFYWPHGTPLHWAIHVGSPRTAQILLDQGADVDEEDVLPTSQAHTPLSSAMYRADSEMVSFLLDRGADPNREIIERTTALRWLSKSSAYGDFPLSNFLRHWIYRGPWERSLNEARKCVMAFQKHGGSLDGRRLLLEAADSGDGATLIALLEHGATPGLVDDVARWGKSALHRWCSKDPRLTNYPDHYFEILEALISRTDWELLDEQAQHALFTSATSNRIEVSKTVIVTLLKEAGVHLDINARDEYQQPPIAHALQNSIDGGQKCVAFTNLFIELGAQVEFRDSHNRDFIWWLTHNLCITDAQCLGLLKQYMSVSYPNSQRDLLNNSRCSTTGVTALMNMAHNAHVECIRFALDLEVDLRPKDEKGKTALDYALLAGDRARRRLLENWAMHRVGKPSADESYTEDFLFEILDGAWEEVFSRGFVQNYRERYFALPKIIQMLATAGAKTGHGPWVRGPRSSDRRFIQLYNADWFVRDEQPFYELWKPLYTHDRWIWILVDICDRISKRILSLFRKQPDTDSTFLSRFMKDATIERLPS